MKIIDERPGAQYQEEFETKQEAIDFVKEKCKDYNLDYEQEREYLSFE